MKTYIINLLTRPDRKDFMGSQMEKGDLDYEFIKAVDGKMLSDQEIDTVTLNFSASHLTKGEVACALSHLSIYQKMIDNNIDIALVLEDDVYVPDNIDSVLQKILSIEQNNKPNIYLLSDVEAYIENSSLYEGIYRIESASKAHCYVINKTAAKKMLKKLIPIRYEADMWTIFNFYNYAHVYCIYPHVADVIGYGDKTDSNLENERALRVTERNKQRKLQFKKEPYYKLYRLKKDLFTHKFSKVLKTNIGK